MHQEGQTGPKAARQFNSLSINNRAVLSTVFLKCYKVQRWYKDREKGEARCRRRKDMHQRLFEYITLSKDCYSVS